jgi:hypothetical protein
MFNSSIYKANTNDYAVWKSHIYETMFIVFMLLVLGCFLWVLGSSYDLGQIVLRLLYPTIPNSYPLLPLLDGPFSRKDPEITPLSSISSFLEEEDN